MNSPTFSPAPSIHPTAKPLLRITVRVVLLGLCVILFGIIAPFFISRQPHRVTTGPDTLKVLFIGNSYTYVNNLPGLLIELSAHEAKPVNAEMVVEGGATLNDHWVKGDALAAIQRTPWDYVVLQEQSTLGGTAVIDNIDQIGDPANFAASARQFDAAIQKAGAKTILYMTWARQNAPQNQALITKAYQDVGAQLQATVAPVGLAWQSVLVNKPELTLFQTDGSHPDPAGSYLAACVFYATLYQKTPVGLPAQISNTLVDDSGNSQSGVVDLSAADALYLQQAAWLAVSPNTP